MKLLLLAILGALILLCAYWGVVFYFHADTGRALVKKAVAYQDQTQDHTKALLVIGDSTGVGVGADKPEDTVAALLANGMHATYEENVAVSGAEVKDLPGQIARAQLTHYDTILVQIGANDVIAFHSPSKVAAKLAPILDTLSAKGGRVLLMMAGDVGATTIAPPPLRPIYTWLSLKYHAAFTTLAASHGATYINLYTPRKDDLFSKHPELYLAPDGLHPSSAGYALWYSRIKEVITF